MRTDRDTDLVIKKRQAIYVLAAAFAQTLPTITGIVRTKNQPILADCPAGKIITEI